MKVKYPVVLILVLALFSSCVVTQSLSFDNKNLSVPGSASTKLYASDFLNDVLEDLSCWTGDENQSAFMDVAVTGVAKSIANSEFSRYVYINKTDDGGYAITCGFSDFNSLINDMSGEKQNIITLEESNGHSELSFNLSMDNYETLKKMIPLLADPNFEAYGPVYNNPPYDFRTEEDYLYMMEFIFGEGAAEIASSNITVLVDTPSEIISTTGVRISDTCTAFEFRLIDFLLLHEPIRFSCTF